MGRGVKREITAEEKHRMRYAHRVKVLTWLDCDPRFAIGFSFYLQLLRKHNKRIEKKVTEVIKSLHLDRIYDREQIVSILKEYSGVVKKYNVLIDRDWRFLVNLENLGGYTPYKEINDFTDDIKRWVFNRANHAVAGEEFNSTIERFCYQFLTLGPHIVEANEHVLTVREYSRRPNLFGGSGSSQIANKIYVTTKNGKKVRPRKTKWRTAYSLKPSEIVEMLLNGREQTPVAIQKSEPAKVRAVINSDDYLYQKENYVSSWLEKGMLDHPLTTLFMSTEMQFDFWRRLSRDITIPGLKVPLDQSEFDHNQDIRMILACLNAMKRFINDYCKEGDGKEDMLKVMDLIILDTVHKPYWVTVGNSRIKYRNGVLSGWRWTSFIDTCLNYASYMFVKEQVERNGFYTGETILNFQGDDVRTSFPNEGVVKAFLEYYNYIGFDVNPGKFWVDENKDEYLRKVVFEKEVTGYPVRIINALLWRNPISAEHHKGFDRLSEQLRLWNTLMGRSGWNLDTWMISDMSNANGITKQQVRDVLSTPASMGGLGYFDRNGDTVIVPAVVEHTIDDVEGGNVEGLKERAQRYGNFLGTIVGHIDIPGKVVVKEQFRLKRVTIPKFFVQKGVSGVGPPLSAISSLKGTDDEIFSDCWRDRLIKERRWKELINEWVTEEMRGFANSLFSRASRTVFVEWIKGGLPFRIPVIRGVGDLGVSVTAKGVFSGYWGRIVMGRPGWENVVAGAVKAEREVRRIVGEASWLFRG
jgi:hypothetical protein